jgi:phenylacetate-coenzyme A ligase PaaK-like adenylate-forming protein
MTSPGFWLSPRLRGQFDAARRRMAMLGEIQDTEWESRQLIALQQVWTDARDDVPYYADLVSRGVAPRDIRSWDDLRAIPILTRRVMQEQPDLFLRRSRRPDSFTRTAGSTGTPLKIGMDRSERDLMRVVKIGAWQEFGYAPDSRVFLMWGHAHLLGTGLRGTINQLKRTFADRMLGYRRVDAYRLKISSAAPSSRSTGAPISVKSRSSAEVTRSTSILT